jgi:hypothetical protein
MYLRACGNFKSANHKKDWANKSAKWHICCRSAILTDFLIPLSCGFAICGTYLRTAHLWPFPYFKTMRIVQYIGIEQ